ncbi:zinc finger, CCHC-type containing protein [Tanacetum coccineum]
MRSRWFLVPTRNQSWNVGSVARLVISKGIAVVVKRTTRMLVVQDRGLRTNPKTKGLFMIKYSPYNHRQNVVAERKIELLRNWLIPYYLTQNPYYEAMSISCVLFGKEAIDDEIGSIMENNTWVLSDLPPGCKSLGCKWIFKRKMKVDGTIDKFKARLVIQGFRQKERMLTSDPMHQLLVSLFRIVVSLAALHIC